MEDMKAAELIARTIIECIDKTCWDTRKSVRRDHALGQARSGTSTAELFSPEVLLNLLASGPSLEACVKLPYYLR